MTSTIKVNTIQNACGADIIKESGNTITIGASGDTVTLGSGAAQTGFGRTGTVDWCTTAKTSPFTAVSGDGFFVNTTSGGITVTLPSSPSQGDIVAIKDYAGTFACNSTTICRNGSKINGECANTSLSTASQSVTLIYVDGTKGWQDIHDSTSNITGTTFIAATGGCVTTSGNFKIHTFNSDANFVVSSVSNQASLNKVSYVVVGGGGGSSSGGGGAGGFREGKNSPVDSYTASPLAAADSGLTVTAATFPITVGGGGAGADNPGTAVAGSPSTFSSISSVGGGLGAANSTQGGDGGSGGGGGGSGSTAGGSGNTPPVSPSQGSNGGAGGNAAPNNGGGGGGGATAVGGPNASTASGPGGAGATSSITGSPVGRAGGGGGGARNQPPHTGGTASDGGGAGRPYSPGNGTSGTANTGGGGGGISEDFGSISGGAGGSGVVIIRYKFQ